REFRSKRELEQMEIQRRSEHDQFINAHGFNAWRELIEKLNDACHHLSSHASASLALMRGDNEQYTVAGGAKVLDVSFDLPSKTVTWQLRYTSRGTLKPDRRENELVFRSNTGQTFSVEDAAAFLIQ